MLRVIVKRLLLAVPLLFLVSLVSFILQSLIPGNPAAAIAGASASKQQIAKLAQTLGLDKPLAEQYWNWLSGAFHGTLGNSLINDQPVLSALNQRLPVTVALVGSATIVATLIGVAFGLVSSRGGRAVARSVDVISIAGLAIPSFWLALLLIAFFSVRLGWLPANGYTAPTTSVTGWLSTLVLPVAALGFAGVTAVAKLTREAMLDVMSSQFIRNLRANGIPERSVIARHCLRSAAIPVVTIAGLLFINSLGASVVIEQVFGLPGLGSLAVSATASHDIPMIQGVAVYFTLLVIAMNLLVDVLYAWINPRVRVR